MTTQHPRRKFDIFPETGMRWLAAAIAVIGIVASGMAFVAIRKDKRDLVETEFGQRAQERALAIERQLDIIVDHVDSLAALYQTYGEVDHRKFSSFAAMILDDHPTIQALGFDPVIPHELRSAHEQAMRDAGQVGYRITERDAEGRLVQAAERPRYVVVTYPEPMAENRAAVGFDIASDPVRRAAIERSTETGSPQFTARIRLVQEVGDQYGALICVPVYHGAPPEMAEMREAALRGVAVGAIRYGDIVKAALAGLSSADIHVELLDGTTDGAEALLYNRSAGEGDAQDPGAKSRFEPYVHEFALGGRRFVVRSTPSASWFRRIDLTPIAVLFFGLLVTAMATVYVVRQSVEKRRLVVLIAQLERARQRQVGFAAMLDDSHDEFYVFDATTLCFVHANLGACRNLGYSMDELRGITPMDLKPAMDAESFGALIQPLREGTRAKVMFTTVHRRKDGSEYDVEVHLQLSTFDGVPAFIALIIDVTDRKQVDERLRQSQRIEALGTLAGGIAHDFNNVLTAIMGYAELTLDASGHDPEVSGNLNEIMRASERARDVVRQILTFSRRGRLERSKVDLAELISETLKFIRVSLPSSVEIRERIEPGVAIRGDSAQIHQALMNLCTNAGHAMRNGGGVLEITMDSIDVARGGGVQAGVTAGSYARVRVTDTGQGIPPEIAEHVFEPFFTTKPEGEGSGMGLAVTHGIVTAHGGTIRLRSRPGKGSTFELLLPVSRNSGPTPPVPSAGMPGGTETILLVDDEPTVVRFMHEALSRAGYTVESFTDSSSAVARFRERPDRFDLVITDNTMPTLGGIDLARRVREVAPCVPLIMVSGYGELLDEAALRQFGIVSVLPKPLRLSELWTGVRATLDGAPPQAPEPSPPDPDRLRHPNAEEPALEEKA